MFSSIYSLKLKTKSQKIPKRLAKGGNVVYNLRDESYTFDYRSDIFRKVHCVIMKRTNEKPKGSNKNVRMYTQLFYLLEQLLVKKAGELARAFKCAQ